MFCSRHKISPQGTNHTCRCQNCNSWSSVREEPLQYCITAKTTSKFAWPGALRPCAAHHHEGKFYKHATNFTIEKIHGLRWIVRAVKRSVYLYNDRKFQRYPLEMKKPELLRAEQPETLALQFLYRSGVHTQTDLYPDKSTHQPSPPVSRSKKSECLAAEVEKTKQEPVKIDGFFCIEHK